MKSSLTGPADYERLTSSPSIKSLLSFYQARYGTGMPPDGTLLKAEKRIEQGYFDALKRILSISPFGLRQVMEALVADQELRVLGSVLTGITEGMEENTLLSMINPFGKYNEQECRRLLETRSVRRALDLVEDPALRNTLLKALGQVGSEHYRVGIELSTEQASARRLWGSTFFLTGRDAGSVRRILGQQFDLQNLLLLARSKTMGVSPGTFRAFRLPVAYRLKASDLDSLSELSSLGEQLREMRSTYYAGAISGISSETLEQRGVSLLETAFNRYMARQCNQSFSGSRFSPGLAVAFLFLKRFETNDLKAILTGKAAGLSEGQIREKIVLYPKPGTLP